MSGLMGWCERRPTRGWAATTLVAAWALAAALTMSGLATRADTAALEAQGQLTQQQSMLEAARAVPTDVGWSQARQDADAETCAAWAGEALSWDGPGDHGLPDVLADMAGVDSCGVSGVELWPCGRSGTYDAVVTRSDATWLIRLTVKDGTVTPSWCKRIEEVS